MYETVLGTNWNGNSKANAAYGKMQSYLGTSLLYIYYKSQRFGGSYADISNHHHLHGLGDLTLCKTRFSELEIPSEMMIDFVPF